MKQLRILAVLVPALAVAGIAHAQSVSRAVFTSGPHVTTREPVDTVTLIGAQRSGIYFFCELQGMKGREVIHRWEYNGEVQIEVSFAVQADSWKTYSYKKLDPTQGGTWTVTVLDDTENVLRSEHVLYAAREPEPEPEPEPVAEPVPPAPEGSSAAAEVPPAPEGSPEAAEVPPAPEASPEVADIPPVPPPAPDPPAADEESGEMPESIEATPGDPTQATAPPQPGTFAPAVRPRLRSRDDPGQVWQQRSR
jgi:hypothetical protein